MLFLNRSLFAVPVAVIFIAAVLPVQAAQPANGIRQIAMGEYHACAVTFGGELLCWGDNRFGQIGDGTVGDKSRYPAQATKRYPTQVIASGATSVSVGYAHTCAVISGGLQCWGWNQSGQVTGTPGDNVLKPRLVIDSGVTAVAAGGMHTCAVVRGAALCWGADGRTMGHAKKIGDVAFKPTQVIANGVTAISAQAQTTCAIVNAGLQCWGDNRLGQVGNGHAGGNVLEPTEIIASGVTAVAIGSGSGCAVVRGALQCWGRKHDIAWNTNPADSCAEKQSKLNKKLEPSEFAAAVEDCNKRINTGIAVPRPTQVIPEGVTAVTVAGVASVCAVVHGALHCWGSNSMGSLGLGADSNITPNPTRVIAGGVTTVSMGGGATCVLVNGALRCRGYNGYGAISSTIDLDKIADSRPFSDSNGDVLTISHAAADAVAVVEKMPEMLAPHLQGQLIAHNNAVYFVRRARATYLGQTAGERMIFNLDVNPLYPTTSVVGNSGNRNAVIPADAECGGGALPSQLATSSIGLRKDHGFVDLSSALKNVFPVLPPLVDGDENFHLSFSAGDMRKIESCAQAFNDAWEHSPVKAIRLGGVEIPRTLGKPWSVPGEGEHATDMILTVEAKPGQKADFFVEAQSVSMMRCGKVALSRWKRGVSSPWKLHGVTEGALGYFYLDEDIVRAVDLPVFSTYTQDELRRAINLEQGRAGLASIKAAQACAPVIEGYKYTIRNQSSIVQEVYNPGFSPIPIQSCQEAWPTLALRVADKLGYLRGKRMHTASCKAWPGDPARHIVALVRPQDGATDDAANYDLDLAMVHTQSGEILQHVLRKGAITSDAMRFDGIGLDTANYALAPGVRAFGVRTRHSHMGGTSSSHETLSLYVPDGNELKPVLLDLPMDSSVSNRGGECNEARETTRTLAMDGASSHGYAHLVVIEKSSNQEIKTLNEGGCIETASRSSHRYVLQFDGTKYVAPKELRE